MLFVSNSIEAQRMEGMASFYADKFDGGPLSVGGTFRQSAYTAASKELDWGTVVEVTNLSNGKTTQVLINDCGPHARGRLIDLSKAAARDLDFIRQGETKVRLRIVRSSNSGPTCSRSKWKKKLKSQGKQIPPPPPPWDPTQTVSIKPINPTTQDQPLNSSGPVPAGITRGMASYYPDRLHGRSTSTGETYDRAKFTAASKMFTYGTRLEVTNIVNGAKTQVLVNDCGPHSADRIIDLSRAAADRIGLVQAGSAAVEIRVLEQGMKGPTCNRSAWAKTQSGNTTTLGPGQVAPPGPTVPGATRPATTSSAGQPSGNLVTAYQLQVGAFGKRTNADAVVGKLVRAGFPDTYAVTSGTLTRVFTGLSATKAEAEAVQKTIAKAGFPKSKVVETQVASSTLISAQPEAAPGTYGSSSTATPIPAPQREYDPTDMLFGVQVGAFSAKANADKAMNSLREAGVREVYSAKVGKSYRVFAGKYYFQSQAETEKNKLREMGFAGASVRRVQ